MTFFVKIPGLTHHHLTCLAAGNDPADSASRRTRGTCWPHSLALKGGREGPCSETVLPKWGALRPPAPSAAPASPVSAASVRAWVALVCPAVSGAPGTSRTEEGHLGTPPAFRASPWRGRRLGRRARRLLTWHSHLAARVAPCSGGSPAGLGWVGLPSTRHPCRGLARGRSSAAARLSDAEGGAEVTARTLLRSPGRCLREFEEEPCRGARTRFAPDGLRTGRPRRRGGVRGGELREDRGGAVVLTTRPLCPSAC